MTRPTHLPDFEAPPVAEVALSLQFQPVTDFGFVHAGLLWQHFRNRFGKVQYHPQLSPAFETFGLRRGIQELRFDLTPLPVLPRLWFMNDAGDEIVQFQPDRFVHNWRKVSGEHEYPRYESIKEHFAAEIEALEIFLRENELGPLIPTQSEVTYVNVISLPDASSDATDRIFRNWTSFPSARPMELEDVSFSARWLIQDGQSPDPIGRLTAHCAPGFDEADKPVTQFTLVGRGGPQEPTIDSALAFMDIARDRIVCGFAEMTTDEMHKVWKRRN